MLLARPGAAARACGGKTGRTANTTARDVARTCRSGTDADRGRLVRATSRAFGPATVADMRTWSWLTGLREVVDRHAADGCGPIRDEAGRELFDVEDGHRGDPDLPAPIRFLPQYDNVFLSHDDRSRISGELSWGVDFGWKGAILVDGGIAAAWRVRATGKSATMTIELGRRPTPAERQALEEEAERLACSSIRIGRASSWSSSPATDRSPAHRH